MMTGREKERGRGVERANQREKGERTVCETVVQDAGRDGVDNYSSARDDRLI